ncbi:MAG TPA: FAD-dependent oxidoreductase [Streptosporangiaceae bacterium]|nr:FAD-dependent oxidoreductase [Streptosporangiaceae bacterium]
MSISRVVVVGGGLAGLRTIEALRARLYGGAVTLVGAERHAPYDRPPLSKQLLAGGVDDTTLDADFAALRVDLRLGETAVGVADGALVTDRAAHPFDRLVVATGALPVTLPGDGPQRLLRTIDDARALRDLLRPGLRLAVVGAGWIGAELATAAAARGCQVTVVEAAHAPLAAAIGAEVGAVTRRWYEQAGVDLRLGTAVASVQPGGLALAGGAELAADEVVTAVGVRPATAWLARCGIGLQNGVAVDEGLRSSLPDVFAAGDCAAFWSRRYDRRLRVEHWDNALHAPEVTAANVLGGGEVYDPVPYFWSEQFGRMLQYAGHHDATDRLIWRGDPAGERWSACWLTGDRLAALLAVDRPRDLGQGRRVVASGAPVDPQRLADPEVPVRSAVITAA